MTTKDSPLWELKAQANKIAKTLKDAEAGVFPSVQYAEKLKEARQKPTFKAGIIMDDKVLTLEIPWTLIDETTRPALAEYIVNQMREAADVVH